MKGYFVLIFISPFVILSSISLLAQGGEIEVEGPGVPPRAPVTVVVNPPGGVTREIYRFTNIGAAEVAILPQVSCPPDIQVTFIPVSLTIPPGGSVQIEVAFADLPGGASVGDEVECLLTTDELLAPVRVRIVPPLPKPIGIFTIELGVEPQTTARETSPFLFELVTDSRSSLTLSGLELSSDLGWGIAGPEFTIFSLKGQLGPLELFDQFVFAGPFDAQGRRLVEGLYFVKKRVRLQFDLAGLRVDNLALLENVKFIHPFPDEPTALDAVQTPAYRFGDILTLKGRTPFDIGLRMVVGLCADPFLGNPIKRRFFAGAACEEPQLVFTIQQLVIERIDIAQLQLSAVLENRPQRPIRGTLTLRTRVFDLQLLSLFTLDVEEGLTHIRTLLSLPAPHLALAASLNREFELRDLMGRLVLRLDRARFSLLARARKEEGLRSLALSLSIPLAEGRLSAYARFTRRLPGPSPVEFESLSLHWYRRNEHFRSNLRATFTPDGLRSAAVELAIRLPGLTGTP